MASFRVFGAAKRIFSCLGFVSGAACGLVSGLDQLQEVACMGACDGGATLVDVIDASYIAPLDSSAPDAPGSNADETSLSQADDSIPSETSGAIASDSTAGDTGGSSPVDANDSSPPAAGDSGPVDASGSGAMDASDSGPTEAGRPTNACGAPRAGSACRNDLSNIGVGDFRITLRITTASAQHDALVNQRAHCGNGMFWDVRTTGGQVRIETDDHVSGSDPTAHFTGMSSTARVDDGRPHCVIISRKAQTMTIFIDGVAAGSTTSMASFAQLAPLVSGTDPCDGQGCTSVPGFGTPCRDGTNPFAGTLSDLCLESP
jgi:hypothetical protein